MRLLDLCKPTCTTSTRGFVRLPLSGERSEEALDGAPSASVSRARSPRRSEGRAPLGTVLRERSFERRAVWDGVFGRSRGEGSASDTLCRARCRSSLRTTLPGARTAAPAPLVKEGGASRSSAPFHRRRAPPRPLAQALQVPLTGFLQSIRVTSATAWAPSNPVRTREVALARRNVAAALLRAPPAGASRSRGPVAALAASASSRRCPEELPRNRSLPSTSLHELRPAIRLEKPAACGVAAARTSSPAGLALARSAPPRHARLRARSDSRFWPRPDHVTEGRPPGGPREGETRLAAPEVPSGR